MDIDRMIWDELIAVFETENALAEEEAAANVLEESSFEIQLKFLSQFSDFQRVLAVQSKLDKVCKRALHFFIIIVTRNLKCPLRLHSFLTFLKVPHCHCLLQLP